VSDKIRCLGIAAQTKAELEAAEPEWKRLCVDWLSLKDTVGSGSGHQTILLSAEQARTSNSIHQDLLSKGRGVWEMVDARFHKLGELGQKYERERAELSASAATTVAEGTAGQSKAANTRTAIHIKHRLQKIASDCISEIQHEAVPTQVWPQSMSHLHLATISAD